MNLLTSHLCVECSLCNLKKIRERKIIRKPVFMSKLIKLLYVIFGIYSIVFQTSWFISFVFEIPLGATSGAEITYSICR